MKIATKYSGEVEINPKNIINFQQGIPSFEEEKEFVLLPFGEETFPLYILQSVQTEGLAFVAMMPFSFFPTYEVKLDDNTIEQLKIEKEEEVAIFTILTLGDTLENSTANLRGPIIVNSAKQLGKQIVLNESGYETKHSLVSQVASGKQEG